MILKRVSPVSNQSTNSITIYTRRPTAYAILALWAVLGALAIAGMTMGGYAFLKGEILAAIALLLANVFLLMTAVFSSTLVRRSLQGRGPLLELTSQTFFDKRISTKPIPWRGIQWRASYSKAGSIQMDVAPEFEHLMLRGVGDRFSRAYCNLTGFPRYTVGPIATGHSTRKLAELFSRFKSPMAR